MTKYIVFENPGEIEINALKLLGASTKRDESGKIGFFGSGWKYAISYMLRNKIPFSVFSGTSEVSITVKATQLRDLPFEQVLINGEETSITTDWGVNWHEWQVFRELASNAFDEGGDVKITSRITPKDGMTKVFVPQERFGRYMKNFSNYFRRDLLGKPTIAILPKDEPSFLAIFKRGVRVVGEYCPLSNKLPVSLFDYSVEEELSEERTVDLYNINATIRKLLLGMSDPHGIVEIVKALMSELPENVYESSLLSSNVYSWHSREFSPAWEEAIIKEGWRLAPNDFASVLTNSLSLEGIKKEGIKFVPREFYAAFKKRFPESQSTFEGVLRNDSSRDVLLSEVETDFLNRIVAKIKSVVDDFDYYIKVVNFEAESVCGKAILEAQTIELSYHLVHDRLTTQTIATLLEEFIHLKHGVLDYSRDFQDRSLELAAGIILKTKGA